MRSNLPHRKDANHNELTQVFTGLGCSVLDLSMVGNDCPDILIGLPGRCVLVELKSEKGKLTSGQERFAREWNGPIESCRNVDEAIAIVQKYRKYAR